MAGEPEITRSVRPPTAIIVVHGVGDPEVGSLIEPVAAAFGAAPAFRRGRLFHDGTSYDVLEADGAEPPLALFEMNWSDVLRPSRSWRGVVEHAVRLAYCMVGLAADWRNDRPNWTSRLYKVAFELGMPWLPLQALAVLLIVSFPGVQGVLTGLGCAVASGVVCRLVWPVSPLARIAGVTTTSAIALLAIARPALDEASLASLTRVSTVLYSGGDAVAALCLLLLTGAIFGWARGTSTREQRAARWLIATLPLLLMSIVGSTLGLFALIPASRGADHRLWQDQHLRSLGFDLLLAEAAMASAFLLSAAVIFAVAVRYELRRRRGDAAAGRGVRDQLPLLCRAVPAALACVGLVLVVDSFGWADLRTPLRRMLEGAGLLRPGDHSVLDVYTVSALRLASLLPLSIGFVRVALDVVGDVIFYAAPSRLNGDIPALLRRRLAVLLDHARRLHPDGVVLVVAHSQGTVVALETLDAIGDAKNVGLLTMGSPIDSLYHRFLGQTVRGLDSDGGPRWINLYRDGDPIGGPIGVHAEDRPIGPGGHTGYWRDPRVHEVLISMIAASEAARAAGPRPSALTRAPQQPDGDVGAQP